MKRIHRRPRQTTIIEYVLVGILLAAWCVGLALAYGPQLCSAIVGMLAGKA